MRNDTILVTGGAGFIGLNFIQHILNKQEKLKVINLDCLTYAVSGKNLDFLQEEIRHLFVKGSIGDGALLSTIFDQHKPIAVINFAAETHVDRSIFYPSHFVQSNVVDLCTLLDETTKYYNSLSGDTSRKFRFIQISTDEVYGSLNQDSPSSDEQSLCCPNSPYAASKASADQFVRAYHQTFGLPAIITRSTNNFGPCQHPEKFIPLVILRAIEKQKIPIYGDGENRRSWIHVSDHCEAILQTLYKGRVGEIYNVGGGEEISNNELVEKIFSIMAETSPSSTIPYEQLIAHVQDRPSHDFRYSLNVQKILEHTGWQLTSDFDSSLRETIEWYINNQNWLKAISEQEDFNKWMTKQYKGEV